MAFRTLLRPRKPAYEFKENDVLRSITDLYRIEKFVGEGSFGKVAKCKKEHNQEVVAVKIVRKSLKLQGRREAIVSAKLRQIDRDRSNIVKFYEYFEFKDHICLTFEMLDISVFDFMKQRDFFPLELTEIRIIAQQMLVALEALKDIGLAHSDIKPDNIMLVQHESQPFKVKLIDFGLATKSSLMGRGTIQALGYRAPEVLLGLALDEAVDMWALGSVLVFLYIGLHFCPTHCEYQAMRTIVQMLGQPEDDVLNSGVNTRTYFTSCPNAYSKWRLKTPAEYSQTTGMITKPSKSIHRNLSSVDDLTKTRIRLTDTDEDIQAFLNLLKRMLHVDPKVRIIPREALKHCYITNSGDSSSQATVTKHEGKEPSKAGCLRLESITSYNIFSPSVREQTKITQNRTQARGATTNCPSFIKDTTIKVLSVTKKEQTRKGNVGGNRDVGICENDEGKTNKKSERGNFEVFHGWSHTAPQNVSYSTDKLLSIHSITSSDFSTSSEGEYTESTESETEISDEFTSCSGDTEDASVEQGQPYKRGVRDGKCAPANKPLVEVKTEKTLFRRISKFFSRAFKRLRCCN